MPLGRGSYHATNPYRALIGAAPNVTQSNLLARSNLELLGFGALTDGALASTGVCCSVPVPVEIGDVITKITVPIGATGASVTTHSWGALYSGIASPALLAQSTDITTASVPVASAAYTYTLASAVQVTPTNAPYGFIYATIAITGTTIPTAAVLGTPTAVTYKWFTNAPLGLSVTHDSSVVGTAPATMGSTTAKAVAPIVFLT